MSDTSSAIVLESGVSLGGLGEAAVGALGLTVASVAPGMLANIDFAVNVEALVLLGLTAVLAVGDLKAAGVGGGGVARLAVTNDIVLDALNRSRLKEGVLNRSDFIANSGQVDDSILKVGAVVTIASVAVAAVAAVTIGALGDAFDTELTFISNDLISQGLTIAFDCLDLLGKDLGGLQLFLDVNCVAEGEQAGGAH